MIYLDILKYSLRKKLVIFRKWQFLHEFNNCLAYSDAPAELFAL